MLSAGSHIQTGKFPGIEGGETELETAPSGRDEEFSGTITDGLPRLNLFEMLITTGEEEMVNGSKK